MTVTTLLPDVRSMIAELIATPSVTSRSDPDLDTSNRAVVERIAGWLDELGFHTDMRPLPGDPDKYNLIATLGRGSGGLVLAGHADTVPWDAMRWAHDPFQAVTTEQRLYGLGSCDMKGFLALAVTAAARWSAGQLARPLQLVVTADEETTMAGARALAAEGALSADAAILGEPTCLQPVRMHKGIAMERLRLVGRSGHSSDPGYGNSAIDGMQRVLNCLAEHRRQIQAEYYNDAFRVPVPTLNLGQIRGGDSPNRICGECVLAYDLRVLPGMDTQYELDRIHDRVRDGLAESGLEVHFESLTDGTPPVATPADSPLVRAAEQFTGKPAQAVAFGTEAAFYQRLGMDVIILGPGSIAQAHQPDEFIQLAELEPTVELLGRFIQRFCADPTD